MLRVITYQEGPFLPPHNGVLDHTARYLRSLCNAGNEITMITPARGDVRLDLFALEPWTTFIVPEKKYYFDRNLHIELLTPLKPNVMLANEPEHILGTLASVSIELRVPLVYETFDVTDVVDLRHAVTGEAPNCTRTSFIDNAYERNSLIHDASRFVDAVICLSQRTAHTLERMGLPQDLVRVIPTSVPQWANEYGRRQSHAATILFFGNLFYLPNELAAREIVSNILPRVRESLPDVRLVVAGDGPHDLLAVLSREGATCTGAVDDLSDVIKDASLLVAPLRAGNDVKSKLLTALACGLPCLTTEVGARGHESTEGIVIEPELDLFYQRIVDLLESPDRLERLSREGYDSVSRKYSREQQLRNITTTFESVCTDSSQQDWGRRRDQHTAFLQRPDALERWYGASGRPTWLVGEYQRGRFSSTKKSIALLKVSGGKVTAIGK